MIKNKKYYQDLFENAPLPYQSLGENGNIITVNNAWLEMLGYSRTEVIGKFIGNYLSEPSLVKLSERFPKFKKQGFIKSADFEMITRSGNLVMVTVDGNIQHDVHGNFEATHCILTNVSEVQKAENALHASERKFKNIVQSSPMGMHMYELKQNTALIFTGANPAADEILGVDHSKFIGKTIEEAFPGLVLTDIPARYRAIAENGTSWRTEQIEYSADGISGAYDVSAFQTEPGRMVTIFTDITRRKQTEDALIKSEERLNFALSATNDGIWDYMLPDGNLFWSARFYTMLDYEPYEFPPSHDNWQKLVHPDDLQLTDKALSDCLEGKSDKINEECRLKSKQGNYLWILLRGKVISRDESGKALRISGTHTNITERKNLIDELVKAKERAEESDQLKSAFLANLSHEIRTPMNAILGFTDLMYLNDLTCEQKESYIDIIHKSGHQLLSIINDIIEISRIETGQIRLHYTPVNIDSLIAELYEQVMVTIPKDKDIRLFINSTIRKRDHLIVTDEVKIREILTNLLTNAIKYTVKGDVSIEYYYNENMTIEFIIKDTGIGIDEKHQQLIFERFSQVEGDISIKQGGSGLGLAISKAYVTMLGGEIKVQSELGKGSAFSFTIPLILNQQNNNMPVPEKEPVRTKKTGNGLILIAEDDELNYLLLSTLLTDKNYKFIRAVNGLEAVDICTKNRNITLVLMDIKMPGMNGYEAVKRIRQINPSLPILAQTAYALESDKKQIQQAGFTGHIIKPIVKEELLDMIESLLE